MGGGGGKGGKLGRGGKKAEGEGYFAGFSVLIDFQNKSIKGEFRLTHHPFLCKGKQVLCHWIFCFGRKVGLNFELAGDQK